MLKRGDIFEIKKGHEISADIPEVLYFDNGDSWDVVEGNFTVGEKREHFDTSFYIGEYVVTSAKKDGGGTVHNDVIPACHHVYATKIMDGELSKIKIDFYQENACPYSNNNPKIKAKRRAAITFNVS